MTFFCPSCWKEIEEKHRVCPYCSADITEHEKKGFEDKLINALRHRERETVQRAVWILGRLKSIKAVKPLIELFGLTDDPFLKRDILQALYGIHTEKAIAFIKDCLNSETRLVKKKAEELIMKDRKNLLSKRMF
ncbi:MAG: HEAT repeat domain-containing protein [Thermodesulfovibrionales bacterium]|nr:HEAT repeat domain-containing protein [Thermodesulfovibrionales bacterium]